MQRKTEIARISYIFCCFRVKISHKIHCNDIEKVEKKTKTWIFSSCWRSSACSSCDCCSCPEKIPCQWPFLGRILKKWEHTPYSGKMEKKNFPLGKLRNIMEKQLFPCLVNFCKIWKDLATLGSPRACPTPSKGLPRCLWGDRPTGSSVTLRSHHFLPAVGILKKISIVILLFVSTNFLLLVFCKKISITFL